MTVSLGMHTQGHLPDTVNDAQQTRRVTRVVYHKDYNDILAVRLFRVFIYYINSINYRSKASYSHAVDGVIDNIKFIISTLSLSSLYNVYIVGCSYLLSHLLYVDTFKYHNFSLKKKILQSFMVF